MLEQGFCSEKERITWKLFRYDINAETWKTNSKFQLNPAFRISHFEFWISHFSNIFSSRHFQDWKKLSQAWGRRVAVFTGDLVFDED